MRITIVSAHPDDIEFALAGAAAAWVREGHDITYCIVTDGSTGTQDRDLAGERLAAIRREESLEAARAAGVEKVTFLGYRDGYVEPTLELRRDIARVFRATRPHRWVTMDVAPVIDGWFINHPDHRAVGQASLDVTLSAGTTPGHFPELLEEGLEPWRGLMEVWIMGPRVGATAVDITETLDQKIAALRAHHTQVGDRSDLEEWVRTWTAELGKPHGLDHAETFDVIAPFGAPTEELD